MSLSSLYSECLYVMCECVEKRVKRGGLGPVNVALLSYTSFEVPDRGSVTLTQLLMPLDLCLPVFVDKDSGFQRTETGDCLVYACAIVFYGLVNFWRCCKISCFG